MLRGLEFYHNRLIMSNTSHDGYESFINNIEAGAVDVVVATSACLAPDAVGHSGGERSGQAEPSLPGGGPVVLVESSVGEFCDVHLPIVAHQPGAVVAVGFDR